MLATVVVDLPPPVGGAALPVGGVPADVDVCTPADVEAAGSLVVDDPVAAAPLEVGLSLVDTPGAVLVVVSPAATLSASEPEQPTTTTPSTAAPSHDLHLRSIEMLRPRWFTAGSHGCCSRGEHCSNS
jgi:hypothetical protein